MYKNKKKIQYIVYREKMQQRQKKSKKGVDKRGMMW